MRPFVVARSVEGTRQIQGWKLFMLVPSEDVVAPPATRRSPKADWKTGFVVLQMVNGSMF